MDTENHKLFKLARIEIPAFTQLNKLKFASDGSISKENISRNCVFSRMFSETCDTKAERFVFSRKSDIYRINIANKGDFVYFLNENGNRYVQDGKYKDFEKIFSLSKVFFCNNKELFLITNFTYKSSPFYQKEISQ